MSEISDLATAEEAGAAPLAAILPPVVLATSIAFGAADVPPGAHVLRIDFSEPMDADSWSVVEFEPGSIPPITDGPRFQQGGRSLQVTFDLAPGRFYAFWLNSNQYSNFRDTAGNPLVPYLIAFKTKSRTDEGR